MVETCNLENWWERWLRFNLYNTASIHTKRGSSEHQNRYSINFKARISICPSDSEMSSETNALEAKGGVGREERWEASGRGGGKERANGEKGRERPSEISICRGWQNGSRRHELPRHVEFVTALFALRVRRKKKRKDRGYRSEVWLDARTHTHTRARTRLDGTKYRLTSVAPSRNFVTSFPSWSGALPGFLLDFFPSLTPSTVVHPYHGAYHPRLRVSPFTRSTFHSRRERMFPPRRRFIGEGRNWILLPGYHGGTMICACKSVYDDYNSRW